MDIADLGIRQKISLSPTWYAAITVVDQNAKTVEWPEISIYIDGEGGFGEQYGRRTVMLVRPDGHLAWRGEMCREEG